MLMDSIFSSDSEDEDENTTAEKKDTNNSIIARKNTQERQQNDPFALPEAEFRRMFRLSRTVAQQLVDEMTRTSPTICRLRLVCGHGIPFSTKFLAVLHFFANGSYQKTTADTPWFRLGQSTMSKGLQLVLQALMPLAPKYMAFPTTDGEVIAAKRKFARDLGMPGILCAVGGTHIAIIRPRDADNGYLYKNAQNFHSLNVLAACDAGERFVYADAQYPGSVLDAEIYQMTKLRRLVDAGDGATFMLGHSGFGAGSDILLTPFPAAKDGSAEDKYNRGHEKARAVLNRTVCRLKGMWRCLRNSQYVLHYDPLTAARITYACMILHNVCVDEGIAWDEAEADYVEDANGGGGAPGQGGESAAAGLAAIFDDGNDEWMTELADAEASARRVRDKYIGLHFSDQ